MKARVLIVEDDAVFRRGLAHLLSATGCEVAQTGDGNDALDLISRVLPDLVICDFRLPGMDGLGILKFLRQRAPDVPFLLVTAYGSREMFERAEAAGAVVLEKPIELGALKKQCEQMLRRSKSRAATQLS